MTTNLCKLFLFQSTVKAHLDSMIYSCNTQHAVSCLVLDNIWFSLFFHTDNYLDDTQYAS